MTTPFRSEYEAALLRIDQLQQQLDALRAERAGDGTRPAPRSRRRFSVILGAALTLIGALVGAAAARTRPVFVPVPFGYPVATPPRPTELVLEVDTSMFCDETGPTPCDLYVDADSEPREKPRRTTGIGWSGPWDLWVYEIRLDDRLGPHFVSVGRPSQHHPW